MDRLPIIKRSLLCFWLGVLSFLPLAGLGLAVAVFLLRRSIRARLGGEWNPAENYLLCGVILAWLGLALSLTQLAVLPFAIWAMTQGEF